jgi:hypothetical protein
MAERGYNEDPKNIIPKQIVEDLFVDRKIVLGPDSTIEDRSAVEIFSNSSSYAKTKIAKVALTAGDANDFAFAWQNPESSRILVKRVIVDVTTAGGTANSVLDVDVVANATSTGDDMLDGIDINATAVYDSLNATDNGTNGEGKTWAVDENGGTNDYVTGKILVANATSLVGNAYIEYIIV